VASRHVTLSDPRVEQPSLQRSYLVPSAATAKPGEAEALEVLSQILGGGTTGRLYRALVIERQVALNAGAWYQGSGLDATRFGVYGSPKPGTTLPQLEEAIEAVIAELLAKGITADELERVKNRLIADAVFAQDSQASLARWFGVALTTGSSVENVNAWTDRMREVSADAVLAAAKTWLDKRRSVTGYLIKDNPKTVEKRS
jgi:zinc protease